MNNFLKTIILCLFVYFMPTSVMAEVNKAGNKQDLKIAMSAAFVSERGLNVYSELFEYISKKLGRKVEFVSGFSYETINQMLDTGMVDMGFVCGLPYVLKKDQLNPQVELLVSPVMKDEKYQGKPVYFSYLIVNKDSGYKEFSDLRNSHFAYNDEISNSGYNMPRSYLIDLGETSGYFKKVSRSSSHEESIRMVAGNEADVSAVDSLVYDYDSKYYPQFVERTRILKVLGPAGIPPIVVSTKMPGKLKSEIKTILKTMNDDPQGKKILEKGLLEKFIDAEDSNYDGIRLMLKKSIDTGFKVIR